MCQQSGHIFSGRRNILCDSVLEQIEVGADGDDLRYWQAKEAMRHAELRLASQAVTLQSFEARGTSILGWVVAIITTVSGSALVSLNSGRVGLALVLCSAFVPAALAVWAAVRIVWPKEWTVPGYEPAILRSKCENELQQIEALATGYEVGIAENAQFLSQAGKRVRRAWISLALTPVVVIAVGFISWAACLQVF